ncbi:MAG: hypothetical protein H6559_19505 [Lewinellaceae bacterium]|nr:hypothetical protein [Lewinellaceae bacterium]
MLNHSRQNRNASYSCHPKVRWVVEIDGVLLIHHELEKKKKLGYPEAAVWDLATQGFAYARMVDLITRIASVGFREAENIVNGCLESLAEQGFLQKTE